MKIHNGAVILQPAQEHIATVKEAIPHAAVGIINGRGAVAVRHKIRETHILRNIGFDIPAPIAYGWKYPGLYPPRDNQKHTAAFATLHKRGFILNEMRTGKSFAALWAAEYLIQEGVIKRVLIVCPKTCMRDVWEQAMFECLPHRTTITLHGTREQRLERLAQGTDFCIINHDGIPTLSEIKQEGRREVIYSKLKGQFDLVIFDEADVLGNHRTRLHKAFTATLTNDTWCWLMTGTPTPSNYVDAWGLLQLVAKHMPVRSWTQFRELMMSKVSQWKWVNRHGSRELLHKLMQPAIRFTQAQCFDLPPVQEIFRGVELSAEQKKLYKQMQSKGRIERDAGEVIAANAAVRVAKLLQISAGAVRDEFGNKVSVDASTRLESLRLVLGELGVLPAMQHTSEEKGKKATVFMPYTYVMEDVLTVLADMGYRVCLINGSTPDWKRKKNFEGLRGDEFDVLLAHPETVAHGVDLTCCESIIWYAPCFGARYYQQGNQRHQGAKQKGNPVIVHMVATMLERERFRALRESTSSQDALMLMYEKALDEKVA